MLIKRILPVNAPIFQHQTALLKVLRDSLHDIQHTPFFLVPSLTPASRYDASNSEPVRIPWVDMLLPGFTLCRYLRFHLTHFNNSITPHLSAFHIPKFFILSSTISLFAFFVLVSLYLFSPLLSF